jgi:hypothetical protein
VIVVFGVQLQGADALTFIVYVCQLSPLTTVSAGALAQAAAQLTTVNTCQLVHTAGTHVGIAHQSLISFHVAQSNTAKCQSVEEFGQTTSHTHCQSAQSLTVNVSTSQFVSVIVTVVIFQLLLLVILAIQFQAGHSSHSSHGSHCGHCSVVLASAKVTVCELSLVNTISSPENAALTIEAQSVQSCHGVQGSPFSHLRLLYLAFFSLSPSSLSEKSTISSAAMVVFST